MQQILTRTQQKIASLLESLLPQHTTTAIAPLHQAMRYCALNLGKCIRGALVYATGEMYQTDNHYLDASALAVELVHSYSLVHDDLPAMDNDSLRRGQASCHKAYDEATAILVGDALQSFAFEILSHPEINPCSANLRCEMIHQLAKAIGSMGMVLGQSEDLCLENKTPTLTQLHQLHQKKTGALIQASIHLGALPAHPSSHDLQHLLKLGTIIGLCFQIVDDILDVTSDTAQLGKPTHSDEKLAKATFVSLLGIDGAQQQLEEQYQQAQLILQQLPGKTDSLKNLMNYIVKREY